MDLSTTEQVVKTEKEKCQGNCLPLRPGPTLFAHQASDPGPSLPPAWVLFFPPSAVATSQGRGVWHRLAVRSRKGLFRVVSRVSLLLAALFWKAL